ncbi:MAG: tRNA (adenosine(37)-N6)-threonylcarbamoyltransferase complex dimerization subunit type 1 TsaB [Terriglobales bacterium]
MILLAADTSGKLGSIALARVPDGLAGGGTAGTPEILEVVPLEGGTFSAQLVPQIADLLKKHGLSKQDIAGFAVASGPGSFTGLRVGLAAIKALAEILEKPIAAVSLLEAVARSGESTGRVFAALDAGRGEVYAGEYEVGASVRMLSERLVSREEVLAAAAGAIVLSPDASLIAAARAAGLRVEQVAHPRSDLVARFGWEKIQAGKTIAPADLEANYIRRSDAEIFAKSE